MRRIIAAACAVLTAGLTLAVSAQQQPVQQQDITRYYEQLTGTMNMRLKEVQDENARLASQLDDLSNKVASLTRENQQLEQEIRKLERQRKAEQEAMDQHLKRLSAQIEKLASLPPPQPVVQTPVPAPDPHPVKQPQAIEDYDVYTVQAGATLTAIAKAFDVSVNDIKKANKLHTNNLRVGQKLRIPKKTKK